MAKEIICVCYGKEHKFKTRKQAMDFFLECMACSDGSERDRYVNIYLELKSGKNYCTDGD